MVEFTPDGLIRGPEDPEADFGRDIERRDPHGLWRNSLDLYRVWQGACREAVRKALPMLKETHETLTTHGNTSPESSDEFGDADSYAYAFMIGATKAICYSDQHGEYLVAFDDMTEYFKYVRAFRLAPGSDGFTLSRALTILRHEPRIRRYSPGEGSAEIFFVSFRIVDCVSDDRMTWVMADLSSVFVNIECVWTELEDRHDQSRTMGP